MKRLTILTTLCVAIAFLGKVQAQPGNPRVIKRVTNVTALWLKPYVDSINALPGNNAPIPAFMQCACVDAHPPVFAGFRGSFRWMVLQQVANKQLLLFFLHAPDGYTRRFKAVCTQGDNAKWLYSNKSFYGLIKLRYAQLTGL